MREQPCRPRWKTILVLMMQKFFTLKIYSSKIIKNEKMNENEWKSWLIMSPCLISFSSSESFFFFFDGWNWSFIALKSLFEVVLACHMQISLFCFRINSFSGCVIIAWVSVEHSSLSPSLHYFPSKPVDYFTKK